MSREPVTVYVVCATDWEEHSNIIAYFDKAEAEKRAADMNAAYPPHLRPSYGVEELEVR